MTHVAHTHSHTRKMLFLKNLFCSRDCELQPSCRVRNLEPDSELCSCFDVHSLFTARRYHPSILLLPKLYTFIPVLSSSTIPFFLRLSSSWGNVGARSVCTLPVEQSSHSWSSHCSAGLVEESLYPEDLHLSGTTGLPSGHARGPQR